LSWWDTPERRPDRPESDDAAARLRNDRLMDPGNSIWRGPEGLRPGWAIPLYVIVAAAITAALFWIVYLLAHLTPADVSALRSQLVPGARLALVLSECCGLVLATAVMARMERRSWLDYGLRGRRAAILFLQGAFWGALLMSALVGTLALTHAIRIAAPGREAESLIGSGLLWAAMFVPAALAEELLFRGYPFFRLARAGSPVRAAVVMSLCFGLAHLGNRDETVVGIAQVVGIGLVFCLAVWRTGSLWWALGAHAAWNWTQTFVFGCATSGLPATGQWLVSTASGPAWLSGGATGPEGSILSLPVLALLGWIAVCTLPVGGKRLTGERAAQ
jgi:uncharacterized protein